MAKIHFGTQLYGRLHRPDGSYVATKFFHLSYLPLVPLGSFVVAGEDSHGFRGRARGLHVGSMLLGYFNVWGFLAALGLTALGVYDCGRDTVPWSDFVAVPAAAIALMLLVIASWLWLGSRPRRSGRVLVPLLALGLPLLSMGSFFGYWWWDRHQHDLRVEASRAHDEEVTRRDTEAADRAAAAAAEQRKAADADRAALAALVPVGAGDTVKAKQPVLAHWSDGNWWPAQVVRATSRSIKVRYEDGTTSELAPADVAPRPAPALLEPGATALCFWRSGSHWWPARIIEKGADENRIRYADGTTQAVEAGGCMPAGPPGSPM